METLKGLATELLNKYKAVMMEKYSDDWYKDQKAALEAECKLYERLIDATSQNTLPVYSGDWYPEEKTVDLGPTIPAEDTYTPKHAKEENG